MNEKLYLSKFYVYIIALLFDSEATKCIPHACVHACDKYNHVITFTSSVMKCAIIRELLSYCIHSELLALVSS